MVRKRLTIAKPKLKIKKKENGNVIITDECGYNRTVVVRILTPWEKIEAIRVAILEAGFVWSERVEKQVRKELNYD